MSRRIRYRYPSGAPGTGNLFWAVFCAGIVAFLVAVAMADRRPCIETAEHQAADVTVFAPPGTAFVIPGRKETYCVRREGDAPRSAP